MLRPALALVLTFAAVALGPGMQARAFSDDVRIGVRADAPPFSYRDTATGDYAGFLVDLCRQAIARLGRGVEEHEVDGTSRFDPELGLDVVCDPTTITIDRARRMTFSPLVFIANASFITRRAEHAFDPGVFPDTYNVTCDAAATDDPVEIGVGLLAGTTAADVFRQARHTNALILPDGSTFCSVEIDTHLEGIRHLCAGRLTHYFGDIDILRYLVSHREDDCMAELHPTFRTYEPYALVISSEDSEFARSFVAAIYQVFAEGEGPTEAVAAYVRHFGDRRMSDALEVLFRMNRIPAGGGDAGE